MSQISLRGLQVQCKQLKLSARDALKPQVRSHVGEHVQANADRRKHSQDYVARLHFTEWASSSSPKGMFVSRPLHDSLPTEAQLSLRVWDRHRVSRKIFGKPAFPSKRKSDSSHHLSAALSNCGTEVQTHSTEGCLTPALNSDRLGISHNKSLETYLQEAEGTAEPNLILSQLSAEDRLALDNISTRKLDWTPGSESQFRDLPENQICLAVRKDQHKAAGEKAQAHTRSSKAVRESIIQAHNDKTTILTHSADDSIPQILMTSDSSKPVSEVTPTAPAQHRPLVVGLTKPAPPSNAMASAEAAAALNKEIEKNVSANTKSAAPADEPAAESSQPKQKKEKAPKQPKAPKAAPAAAPTSPALIDLRVGHILRAIAHPNADSLYVSTIAMGDPEGTEHTQVDEETGKVVRTVCSGLNGLVPLAEMQDRKIIVVANLKPVNMRSIKSAAMVLAASPKAAEGADPHAPDRVVELVMPPAESEAGDKVYFEGWPYGEGKGPEKQLNPKKKQWEAIQPGFYTGEDLVVGFDASHCDEVDGSEKGNLVVEGKGVCTVKTLKGAVVR